MPKTSNVKKELILNSALKLFASIGYNHTTVDNIASVAHIGKGTIYLYYDNKLQILLEVFKRGLTKLDQTLKDIHSSSGNLDHFSQLVYSYFNFIEENPELFKVLMKEQDQINGWETEALVKELKSFKRKISQKFVQEMRQLITAGALPPKEPECYAIALNELVTHFSFDWLFGESNQTVTDKTAMALTVFLEEALGRKLPRFIQEKEVLFK